MLMAAFGGFLSGDILMATIVGIIGLVLFPPLSKVLFGKNARKRTTYKDIDIASETLKQPFNEEAGFVEGHHYAGYVERVKQLKRENRHSEAIELLLRLVNATENEAKVNGWGVAPWYYEELAGIYRKLNQPDDEQSILERYDKQPKARGKRPEMIKKRLNEIRKNATR